jgi:hypothetical protein
MWWTIGMIMAYWAGGVLTTAGFMRKGFLHESDYNDCPCDGRDNHNSVLFFGRVYVFFLWPLAVSIRGTIEVVKFLSTPRPVRVLPSVSDSTSLARREPLIPEVMPDYLELGEDRTYWED